MTRMRPPVRRRLAAGALVGRQVARALPGRLAPAARAVPQGAFGHAIRLGHPYVGGEHLLLALAGIEHPTAAALREHGVTPERVEAQVVRLWGGGLFGDLDRSALAAIGIDVDAVLARVTGGFDPNALREAGQRARRREHPGWWPDGWWDPRPRSGIWMNGVFLPHSRDVGKILHHARLDAWSRHDTWVGVSHLAHGLVSVDDGLVPEVFAALGVSGPELRSAITGSR
jgi:hypothetical protein